jgi:hypothetical protein
MKHKIVLAVGLLLAGSAMGLAQCIRYGTRSIKISVRARRLPASLRAELGLAAANAPRLTLAECSAGVTAYLT